MILAKVLAAPTSTWKHVRSCVMAVSQARAETSNLMVLPAFHTSLLIAICLQVVEYIEEEAWVDQ